VSETSEKTSPVERLVIRCKAVVLALLMIILFWQPFAQAVRKLPWRWVKDEYIEWVGALKVCVEAAKTGEKQ